MILWAIRHKPTGRYLPQPKGRGGRGGTFLEPMEATETCLPRLLHTKSAAQQVLRAWLLGRWVCHRDPGDWMEGIDASEEVWIQPVDDRKAEDMEVVPVELVLPARIVHEPKIDEWVAVFTEDRVGRVCVVTLGDHHAYIQFGADGPYEWHPWAHLRPATKAEIDEKTGQS